MRLIATHPQRVNSDSLDGSYTAVTSQAYSKTLQIQFKQLTFDR